jgi:hypothetical protein
VEGRPDDPQGPPVQHRGVQPATPGRVATAEDTILAKLEWAEQGGSDRQLADVVSILHGMADSLDQAHLDRWAVELGVTDLLTRARHLAAHLGRR